MEFEMLIFFENFSRIFVINIWQKWQVCYIKPIYCYDNIWLNSCYRRNVSEKTCGENRNTLKFSTFFFRKSWCLSYNVGKLWYNQTGQRRQCNTVHALCMLDEYGYRHTLRIWSTYCFCYGNNCYTRAPQFCVVLTLSVLQFHENLNHNILLCCSHDTLTVYYWFL